MKGIRLRPQLQVRRLPFARFLPPNPPIRFFQQLWKWPNCVLYRFGEHLFQTLCVQKRFGAVQGGVNASTACLLKRGELGCPTPNSRDRVRGEIGAGKCIKLVTVQLCIPWGRSFLGFAFLRHSCTSSAPLRI
eukprot:5528722-Amphidinium_carterae.1